MNLLLKDEDNLNTNGARGDKLGSIENITGTDSRTTTLDR